MITPEDIYKANASAHDGDAVNHDRNVMYIRRPRTRKYYWDLLDGAVRGAGQNWAGARVLELGCGTGTYTDCCLDAGAKEYTGVDLSAGMLARARAKFPEARAKFYRTPLEEFSAQGGGRFEIIFSFSFLHHLPDLAQGLAAIRNLLTPDGVYVAMHEVNTMRHPARLENLDARLQILYGAFGYHGWSLKRRLALALLGTCENPSLGWKMSRLGERLKAWLKGRKYVPPATGETPAAAKNYVDYQLNEPFSLSAKCAGAGVVRPYCYLGFPELMIFGRPLNHEMLVMKKTADGKQG
jgi:SAM-dependent methyltransferase